MSTFSRKRMAMSGMLAATMVGGVGMLITPSTLASMSSMAITQDADGDGVCDGAEIVGCQDSTACNYDAAATDPGTCDYITCTEQPEGCEADLNQSGTVGVDDLLMLLAEFGCTGNCPVDVDGDGVTGVTDILLLLSSFGVVGCATGG